MAQVRLREIAHSRAGDKGNTLNLSLIVYRPEDYPLIERRVTAERLREHFAEAVTGAITRYELPNLGALNFVLEGALAGGVTRSLCSDPHGKSLSFALLDLMIEKD
ncbi:MAG: hypothetical protein HPY50_19560 [Firmicutes bacterium]|nr:hypothetical protein [Bacillota bacterium]